MAAAGTAPRRLSASSAIVSLAIVLAAVATCSSLGAEAAACSSHTFSGNGGGGGRLYASCADLPRLGAALHYNYTAATNTVSVAFRAPQGEDDGWVAWGINPSGRAGMVGTNAVVAFRRANGTLAAYPTVLDS
ncbi:hypothetical protein GQ55_6G128200 [Panicum hallii var. hallii]|uniref:DOMON domain-containing protein n=1 Tax=Panicum hallii var. hallii TaxID=1504633 RepID=A0A2T7D5Y9_9POAL|nr:hypothetical protein GQ55_6G128200 [Panicum hallii var. hallii]